MTYGIARAATSPELTLYRTPGKKSVYYAAIFQPHTIYTARVNQTFTAWDGLLQVTYDGGSGTLANVKADMLMYIGTSAGARDVGIVRVRSIDSTIIKFGQTSGIKIMDNHYLTIVDDYRLLSRNLAIVSNTIYMDGETAYTNQNALPDPMPIMGSHRVVKMTDSTIDVEFDFSQSYMIDGSAISTKVTTAPTSSAITGDTTYTPTVTFDTCGWHAVYLTLTGANGKSFFGVRYVYVWNDDNLPPRVKVGNISGDINAGGWQFDIEAYRNADLDDIHEGTLVILFSVDYWGDTEQSIGAVEGSENIEAIGWIGSPEQIAWNPERTAVRFAVYGAWYWLQKCATYPSGLQFVTTTPTLWTEFQNLTVDKGVWHFLHWKCTATRILDFFPSGVTKYAAEVSSLSSNLWGQLQEMAAVSLLARPGFNAEGQLFMQVHPQLTPEASRTWATVIDLTSSDWIGEVPLERVTIPEVSQAHLSGISVSSSGAGTAFFAISPGNTHNLYGQPDTVDKLLVASQAEINLLSGLYFNWRNNVLPDIPLALSANIRLIDLFPNQNCTITIPVADTQRVDYTGAIIPKSITVNYDDNSGRAIREIIFEAETLEGMGGITEIIPGVDDRSTIPDWGDFPTLPPFEVLLPGSDISIGDGAPAKILVHLQGTGKGLAYTLNGYDTAPHWVQWNTGLTSDQYENIDFIAVAPNGAIYVGNSLSYPTYSFGYLARADVLGGTFTILEDVTSMISKMGGTSNVRFLGLGINRGVSESVLYGISKDAEVVRTYLGAGASWTPKVVISGGYTNNGADFSYGAGQWMYSNADVKVLGASADAITASRAYPSGLENLTRHIRVGTSEYTIHWRGSDIALASGNGSSYVGPFTPPIGTTAFLSKGIIACSLTGRYIMASALGGTVQKSTDYGYSWSVGFPIPGDHFVSSTPLETGFLVAGAYIKYTPDMGSHWNDKQGDITSIAAIPICNAVAVVP